jgi:hypothetical protein
MDKLNEIVKNNMEKINKLLNDSKVENTLKFIKDLLFDNLILIFFMILIANPGFATFRWYTIFIIIGIVVVNYIAKYGFRRYTDIGNTMRTNSCLEKSLRIIANKQIKPMQSSNLLNRPLYEFYINTSHNTYVPCNQNIDVASTESIKMALAMGARVIELDCYAKNNIGKTDDDMTPVVTHGIERSSGDIFTTSYITFEDCIDTIATFGFLTSDPLIVCLELNTNRLEIVQKKMKQIIKNKLGDKLLKNNNFTKEPIKNLLNKVIFICGGGNTAELNDILSGNLYDSNVMNNLEHTSNYAKNENKFGILSRVYPDGDIYGHFSYNFDPLLLWKNRYQMVAFNFQVIDDNMMKNIAMFKNYSFVHFSEL